MLRVREKRKPWSGECHAALLELNIKFAGEREGGFARVREVRGRFGEVLIVAPDLTPSRIGTGGGNRQRDDVQAGVVMRKDGKHLVEVKNIRHHVPQIAQNARTAPLAYRLHRQPELPVGADAGIS